MDLRRKLSHCRGRCGQTNNKAEKTFHSNQIPDVMSVELVFKAKVGDFGDFHHFEGMKQACK
jgi:hypothetical protein